MNNSQNAVQHTDEADADHYTIMRMGELLAGVAIALKGPEEAGKRHGYQDLPQLVQALVFEVEILKQQAAQPAPAQGKRQPKRTAQQINSLYCLAKKMVDAKTK
jgi:hypothetical protein